MIDATNRTVFCQLTAGASLRGRQNKSLVLTDQMKQFIIGTVLGDSHLESRTEGG